MKTPVAPTPEHDLTESKGARPTPPASHTSNSSPPPTGNSPSGPAKTTSGFFGCYAIVLLILAILYLVLHLGQPGGLF